MLHTFFLKPFNLLSSLISYLNKQEVLPLSSSNHQENTLHLLPCKDQLFTRSIIKTISLLDFKFFSHRDF
ncbi:hypothetical protein GIB67_042874 [Kingdonia uniflora]|uniref:Uncharacterized protein n=1 Tax=Kingdonia uniflora TaxID=39325 RepID=A0A7J7P5T5_9MAGN|nr:hypothetical protein GIB67_042874 [Kingdonia uniflora]